MNLVILLIFKILTKDVDRLGHDNKPSHYDLFFDLQDDQFKGEVAIDFVVNSNTKTVKLNASDLTIKNVTLIEDSKEQEGRATLSNEVLEINFDEQLEKGKDYRLKICFSGKYSDNIDGIYKSEYYGKTVISTHFEPTTARKAFPCFDQPDLKATFSIRVKADPSFTTVISNSSEKEIQQGVHIFDKTVPMSTYLVAFVVGKMEFIEGKTKKNIPIRVYTDKADLELASFALDVAKEAMEFFEKYFSYDYQFPKLDLVPIPSFAMGAMENWGLVTFRRSSLLFNDKKDTTLAKLRVAETVCHELAHMWFGNLVTMDWWNDLWLNEGFATWASYMALNNIKLVDLDVWMNFINDNLERGMVYDSLHSSHPIAVDVKNPSEISQIFDSISYSKGSSIIRMLETYMGHESFRSNIQNYIKSFKFKNSVSSDLFKYAPSSDETLEMLDSWIKQEGFPIIRVKEEGEFIKLEQTRFLSGKKNNGDKRWIVPITVAYTDKEPKKYLMDKKSMEIQLESKNYKLNYANTGVYRVLYSKETFRRILQSDFDEKEKLNIVNDMFSLSFGGYLDMKWTLDTIKKSLKEKNYEILKSILSHVSKLYVMFYDDLKAKTYLEDFLNELFSPLYNNFDLSRKDGKMGDRLKNSTILSSSLLVKNKKMTDKMKIVFEEYKKGKKDVNPDYLQSMFNAMVDDNIDWVIELYKTTNNSTIRTNSARALGTVHRLENLEKMLNNYKVIDRQDFIYFARGLGLNYKFKKDIIDFFINKFDEVREYINNESILNSLIESIFCEVSDEDLRNKVESFISNLKIPESNRSIRKINEMNYNLTTFKNANKKAFD